MTQLQLVLTYWRQLVPNLRLFSKLCICTVLLVTLSNNYFTIFYKDKKSFQQTIRQNMVVNKSECIFFGKPRTMQRCKKKSNPHGFALFVVDSKNKALCKLSHIRSRTQKMSIRFTLGQFGLPFQAIRLI